jgi:Peptidase_C39 like family
MSRVRKVAIGAFVALLAATPFIPRGNDSDSALRPSGERELSEPLAPGPGVLTAAMRREIDRVVAKGRRLGEVSARQAPAQLAGDLVRCAEFDGQRYCLHTGWTTSTEADVRARVATATRALGSRRAAAVESTGDLDLAATLRRTAALSPAERAATERAELTAAARSVAKVWMLRHEVQGVPLPAGFSAAHPEAGLAPRSGTTSATSTARTKTAADYPRVGKVLRWRRTAEQTTTYWCGPTTMQMIAWGWQDERKTQRHWANRLGTTTSGTAITQMVRVVNESTGYDRESRAGTYITLDISDWSFAKWALLNMRHIVDYRAPLVLHPVLLKRYYPYLDDDASGHFQVGRGYNKNGSGPLQIGFFEPWNQQRFDPSEPYIGRVQWRSAYRSYRANQAHFQHNIGV